MNLAEVVWKSASADRVALVEHSTGARHRYGELKANVERLADALVRRGLQCGDVVALRCDSNAEFVVACHGVLLAGGVVLPLEPRGSTEDWAAALSRSKPRFVVGRDRATADLLIDDLVAAGRPGGLPSAGGGDRPAVLLSSSGTQDVPRQVVLTHRNLTVNLTQIDLVHRLTAADVVLGLTPFGHIYGMQMAMNPALRAGATLVTVSTPFSGANLLDVIARRRVTVAYAVPSVLAELALHPDVERYDTSALRLVFSGGAPLPLDVAKTCAERLGVPVVQGYGMTEAGCTCAPPDGEPITPGSIGRPLPDTETRFINPDTGAEGESGEIWVRGPQVSPGYLVEPGVVVPFTDAEGWLDTGDLGRRDERGYVTITGRRKQVIKYKGYQVAPSELEEVLLTHPNVVDAVVVGVPDDLAGELPKAFVVLNRPVALAGVAAYVAAKVAAHKKIRLIEAVDRIPRSAMGKVPRDAFDGGGR
ncbi:Acyl-CoA synthetase (AMP-forming)/AMP-acid ligase II [Lentzea waywayandensis]|uniref:Acyl-CoA synthetase (AMP-forming)/AMP-acid ligase II n=1 Tax=Lentzea waywayandensis TaxID=84724 RepID=A0A1I6FK29_9PSEU|nr:AMP-binding protein [Lentzea waywayandensis]SFR30157.1 Acyl-CoA synthetase (AMP-forming)/AMP-acid ligase II [Lentzea waywayandensis]